MSLTGATPLVIDASAFGEYLLGTELGLEIASIIEGPDSQLHAPSLCDVEVCSGMRRALRLGWITPERAIDALGDYLGLPLTKHGHAGLVPRIFALRENCTAADASYIALAENLGATLVTCDSAQTRAAQDHVSINVIGVAS